METIDLHMHSYHSRCAQEENTVATMVAAAARAGLAAMGITDHLHPHIDPAIYADNRTQLAALDPPLRVWIGAEVDVLTHDGAITGEPALYRQLDYVLAGVHHYHCGWVEGPDLTRPEEEILRFAHHNLLNTIRNPWVDAVAHPYVGIFKVHRYPYSSLRREWVEEAGDEARTQGTALEVPTWALFPEGSLDTAYLEHVVRPLIRSGCPLSTGTDSHHLPNIGRHIGALRETLLREGASESQLWSPEQRRARLT